MTLPDIHPYLITTFRCPICGNVIADTQYRTRPEFETEAGLHLTACKDREKESHRADVPDTCKECGGGCGSLERRVCLAEIGGDL